MNVKLGRVWIPIIVFFLICFGSFSVSAKTEIVPGGPWLSDNQTVKLNAFSSYDELVKALTQIEKTSKGLVELESIGKTNQGRDIFMAKIGDPKSCR